MILGHYEKEASKLGGFCNLDGSFNKLGYFGGYWSATGGGIAGLAGSYSFLRNETKLTRNLLSSTIGLSCRCVQSALSNEID